MLNMKWLVWLCFAAESVHAKQVDTTSKEVAKTNDELRNRINSLAAVRILIIYIFVILY